MPEVQWYYARDEKQFGPVSAMELKQLADSGQIAPDDLLWREGMDAWTTAVNLRGLFVEESASNPQRGGVAASDSKVARRAAQAAGQPLPNVRSGISLRVLLRAAQIMLWVMCVLVVLVGIGLFTKAFLAAKSPAEEAAGGALYSTFFIGAYLLARCGEKLSKLLMAVARRRSR